MADVKILPHKEVSEGEKKFVQQLLDNIDEPIFTRWITKKKRNKIQPRLLVLSRYRLFSIKRGVSGKKQVQRQGHILDLKQLISNDSSNVITIFKNFVLEVYSSSDIIEELITALRTNVNNATIGFPALFLPEYTINPADRMKALGLPDFGVCDGLLSTYLAQCNYYGAEPSQTFIQFVSDLYHAKSRELNLDQCSGIELKTEYSFRLKPVVAALRHNSYFTSFRLDNVQRTDAVLAIADTMRFNRKIEKITINDVLAVEGFTEFGIALTMNPRNNLREIDFSYNFVREKGALGLASGLAVLGTQTSSALTERKWIGSPLEILRLKSCAMTSKGIAGITKALQFNYELGCNLTELDLSENALGSQGSLALSNWLTAMKAGEEKKGGSLKKLILSDCQLDVFVVTQAIKNSIVVTLEHLDISLNKIEKPYGFQGVSWIMENTTCLKYVNLSNCHLNADGVFDILMALNSNGSMAAIQIDLSNNDIGPEGASTVAKALMISHNLHTLKLKSCKLGNEGVQVLSKAMEENKSTKVFDISFNMKSGKGVSEALKALSDLLNKGTALEKLLISGNEKFWLGKEISGIFPAVKSAKINALDIGGHKMGDALAIEMTNALRSNVNLTYLSWDNNYVNLGGYQALASCLKSNKKLQEIPTPVDDLERALEESKDKRRLKEKLVEAMTLITRSLASNRGEQQPQTEFSFPMSKRDERLTKSVMNMERPDSMIKFEGSVLVKSFLTTPVLNPSPSVQKKEETDYSALGTLSIGTMLEIPPPIPAIESTEVASDLLLNSVSETKDDDLPPPPLPPPY